MYRSLKVLMLFFMVVSYAHAMGTASGWCENGNQQVITPGDQPSTTRVQRSYPQCTVNVYYAGTTIHATLYSDNGITPKANPFTASTSGYWFFFSGNGSYDVVLSGAGLSSPLTLPNITIFDPGSHQPYYTTDYIWSQSPGGSIAIGSNIVTLAPCPDGIAGSPINETYVYLSGGSGSPTPEAIPITGGTCTSGAATGTINFTATIARTGSWSVGTATAGIQEALNANLTPGTIYAPCGDYSLHGPIKIPYAARTVLSQASQWQIQGGSRNCTTFNVGAQFPLSVDGVFNAYLGVGPYLKDFKIIFIQDYTQPVASFTHWPAALYSRGASRGEVERLRVEGSWVGFDVTAVFSGTSIINESNGWIFNDLELAAYSYGMKLDGSFDITRISQLQCWPWGANAGVGQQMMDQSVTCLDAGHLDGLFISDSFFLSGTNARFHRGQDLGIVTFGSIVNTSFDIFGSIIMDHGAISISNAYFYQNQEPYSGILCTSPARNAIHYNAGILTVTNSTFYKFCVDEPTILITPSGADSTFVHSVQVNISNNKFYEYSSDADTESFVSIVGNPGAGAAKLQMTLSNNQFSYDPAIMAYTNPVVSRTDTNVMFSMIGNIINPLTSGSGVFVYVDDDGPDVIQDNIFAAGWTGTIPALPFFGLYQNPGGAGPVTYSYNNHFRFPILETSSTGTESYIGLYNANTNELRGIRMEDTAEEIQFLSTSLASPAQGFRNDGGIKLHLGYNIPSEFPSPEQGVILYCFQCQAGVPTCTGGGFGTFAFGVAGAWKCF